MAVDIMLNNSGDIEISSFADIMLIQGNNEIIQSAIVHMYTVLGENEFHPAIGNAIYNRRVKASYSNLRAVEADCRTAILQDKRIASVDSITATMVDGTTKCNISFTITTIDGAVLTSDTALNFIR